MRITWIIGNGFDVNLGLKTGYRDFRERVYFTDSCKSELRNKLVQKLVDADLDELGTAELWSDLEELLGKATEYYEASEIGVFYETFEEMERLLTDCVHVQESRLPDALPGECIDEFKESVARFDGRMVPQDRRRFNLEGVAASIVHRFVSLNYTQALTRFIDAACDENRLMSQHKVGGSTYRDIAEKPFYVHGAINEGGEGTDVIFGLDSPEQIANEAFSRDAGFAEAWVKASRNTDLYGNTNEQELQALIADADVFCVYGCSMGKTDGRIWRAIGDRLIHYRDTKLVLFVYDLPYRHGYGHREYQAVRESWRGTFQQAAGLSDEDMASLDGRIFFVSSKDYFKWNGKIELRADPHEAGGDRPTSD